MSTGTAASRRFGLGLGLGLGLSRGAGWGAVLVSMLSAGCALYGPDVARVSHIAYNEAVQESEQRELLLNLVRLRYSESPQFLAVSNISTQMRFEAQASVSGDFGRVEGATSAFAAPGLSFGYSESPTVVFTPQQGVEFTRRLVAPVGLDSLYLLTQYGWGLDRTLRVIAQDINGVTNLRTRETPLSEEAISLRRFAALTKDLRSLHERNAIRLEVRQRSGPLSAPLPAARVGPDDLLKAAQAGYRYDYSPQPPTYRLMGTTRHYVLAIDETAGDAATLRDITRTLGLPPGAREVEIDPADAAPADVPALRVRTRSVLGAMAYLSAAVAVPEAHNQPGAANGDPASSVALADLLTVKVSAARPEAIAAVPFRGYWFYVEDGDIESKRTLGLLTSLMRLEIGAGGAENIPVLTLPLSH